MCGREMCLSTLMQPEVPCLGGLAFFGQTLQITKQPRLPNPTTITMTWFCVYNKTLPPECVFENEDIQFLPTTTTMPDDTSIVVTNPTSHTQSPAMDVGTGSTTVQLNDSFHAVDRICLACKVVTTSSINQSFYHLCLLFHHAVRRSIETLETDLKALTSILSNNHFYDLERCNEHLSCTVHAHQLITQSTLNNVTDIINYTPTLVPRTPTSRNPRPLTQLN